MNVKKLIALSAVCLICAGCGSKNDSEKSNDSGYGLDAKKPTTITIWHYYNGVQQEFFDNAVIEFNETVGKERGIVVESYSKGGIDELAADVLASIKEDAGAEEMPDMFASYAETAYIVDKLGYAVDLSEYFTADELGEYIEGYINEGKLNNDNSIKIFPTAKSTEIMMLNLTDWEKFTSATGVKNEDLSTWEGVAETAEKYYNYTDSLTPDIENDGKAFFGRDSVANYMIVGSQQLGAEFVTSSEDGFALNLDKSAIRRLWDNYYVPYVKGYFTAHSRYRSDDAKIGEIISMICSTTGAAYFPDSVTIDDDYSYPIECLVLPVPNFEGTEPYVVQQGAGMVVTKSDSKSEYACTVFLKWFTEKERNTTFAVGSGYMPVKKSANNIDMIKSSGGDVKNQMVIDALSVAVDEINTYTLYTTKPFENSSETRNFLGDFIQDTAQSAHDEAYARIAEGENREKVLDEYISDKAFEKWFEEFSAGMNEVFGL